MVPTSSLAQARLKLRTSSSTVRARNALYRSGRLIVIHAKPSSTSYVTSVNSSIGTSVSSHSGKYWSDHSELYDASSTARNQRATRDTAGSAGERLDDRQGVLVDPLRRHQEAGGVQRRVVVPLLEDGDPLADLLDSPEGGHLVEHA